MAAFVGERVRIRDTSVSVSVPQNSKAKLMYYLNCVATVIQLDDPALSRLKNYQSYYLLSQEETDALLALVILLSPDELIAYKGVINNLLIPLRKYGTLKSRWLLSGAAFRSCFL